VYEVARSNREVSKLLDDLRQTRDQLDRVLKDGALHRNKVAESCRILRETLDSVRAGKHTPNPVAEDKHPNLRGLTKREIEVLRLIAEGRSTKEIAYHLNISFKTAVAHRTHLLQKLGIHESATLVRLAVRAGLVSL